MAKNISIKDRTVRIQIWDTAGQEAYRSITRSYYKSAACVFIVYDISDKKSFMDVDIWLKDCRDICSSWSIFRFIRYVLSIFY